MLTNKLVMFLHLTACLQNDVNKIFMLCILRTDKQVGTTQFS